MIDFTEVPHRRYNPLLGEWVLCSPHRTKRPWQGQQETPMRETRPQYDPTCYLCPGNKRAESSVNPAYESTYVFKNDFSALLPDSPLGEEANGLLISQAVRGECRVICFSPRHDQSLAEMEVPEIAHVVDTWADQITELGAKYRWVQLFENKGQAMGASNPHPHGQLWACDFLPTLAKKESEQQLEHYTKTGQPLLVDYLNQELEVGSRIVTQTEHWAIVVPFWAVWPYEYLLLPKRHVRRLPDLSVEERISLAEILKDGIGRYDRLFQVTFPYSMGWHGAPTDGEDHEEWQLHAHFYPPLLRSATVRKFMVGFEMLAESQRDITPEQAAEKLRAI